ncbi:MAG: acetyl-CoA synthetase [Gammaproteobacteria bacterium]|nr:acetyl-CoA synthetase [Gammaproteobacteria bacterium]
MNDIITAAQQQGRELLNEVEAKTLMHEAGVPVVRTVLADSSEQAKEIAGELGYPVALKVVSEDITHKSDAGGVMLDIADSDAVAVAYEAILSNSLAAVPGAEIEGVAVQNMAPAGTEVIVGMTTDPQFGPVVMFGLGGVMVEVMKDVTFRVLPLTKRDVRQMVADIKGRVILDGVRGAPPADVEAIQDALLKVADFVSANPQVRELDLNPILVNENGAVAVDARIVIAKSEATT